MNTNVLVDIPAALTWHPTIPAGTIRYWASTGNLTRRGIDRKGRTLYRLADIDRLAETHRPRRLQTTSI